MKSIASFAAYITIVLFTCHGQSITIVTTDSSKYWIDTSVLMELKTFDIQNKSTDTLVLWIDSAHATTEDIGQSAIRYFRKNRIGNWGNLMSFFFESQILWNTYHPEIYLTFFTTIPPKQSFRVIIDGETEFDPNWIVSCSKQTLKSVLPWISFGHNFRQLCYKSDVIVIR